MCTYNTILDTGLDTQGFWVFRCPGASLPRIPRHDCSWTHLHVLNHLGVSGGHLVRLPLSVSLGCFLRHRDVFLDKQKIAVESGVLTTIPQSSSQCIQILSVVLVMFFNKGCCFFSPSPGPRVTSSCHVFLSPWPGTLPQPFSRFLNLDIFEEVRLLL